jgi:hypothetical protein
MSVNLSPVAGAAWQFFDDNGNPLSGGKIYTYAAGSSTPQTTFTTNAGNIQNSNPIILDADGRLANEVWLTAGIDYKFALTDANDVQIGTYDNLEGINDVTDDINDIYANLANTTDNAKGDAYIGFRQSTSSGFANGSVGRTVSQKLRELYSVLDFGATGNGSTDDTAAIQAAINAVGNTGGGIVYFPEGTYRVTSELTITFYGVTLEGAGRGTTIAASADTHNIIKIGGTSALPFRCGVRDLHLTGGNIAVLISYNSAQSILENLYISGSKIGIEIKGDYTTSPIKDTINNHIYKVELENIKDYGIHLLMCGDVYISDVQTPSPQVDQFGMFIDSGVTAVYADHVNCTGGQGGILINDGTGISPNPTGLPSTPRQMYFYQVQGDTCRNFGIQIQKAYQITFVDSWGSGSTQGPGWIIGNGTSSIRQIALIGCRALGNSQDGFRWVQGNTDLGSQMVGCHAISNGYASSNTYDGINVQANNSGLVISGCNSYNDDSQGLGVTQSKGINIEGNVTNVVVTGNNLNNADGNIDDALVYDSTTHTGNIITDNIGFNNVGFAASPAVPASGTPYVNPYGRPMLVYVNGGTVSAIKIDTITVATGTGYTAYLGPNHEITIDYSVIPNWSWVGM